MWIYGVVELEVTTLGKRLAQHPYDRAVILNAGIKVSGDHHRYPIPFNQLLTVHCKRGLVRGKLKFILPDEKVVRLRGTEWDETQHFYHHLDAHWRRWSDEMNEIASGVLRQQLDLTAMRTGENKQLTREQASGMQQQIRQALPALPLLINRLEESDNCCGAWRKCQAWLKDIGSTRLQHNQAHTEAMLTEYTGFFRQVESSPLNPAQTRTVINDERPLLVLAGAESEKTSVLMARAGWLLARGETSPERILLLTFGRKTAKEMDERIRERSHTEDITARTFHALALRVIQQDSKEVPIVGKLENDTAARHELFIAEWRKQCSERKARTEGWWQWLTEEIQWSVPEDGFWDDEKLQRRLTSRLDHWIDLMRMHDNAQVEMVTNVPGKIHDLFSRRTKLMAPLLKVWEGVLKAESAVDFSGLIHQAVVILRKGCFISPWRYILVDEFQDISPQWAALLVTLCKQDSQTTLLAIGDDWQAIYRFNGARVSLITAFHENLGKGERCDLNTAYHFDSRTGEVTNRFIQQNPGQLKKPLNSLTNGGKETVALSDKSQLDALLDKLSGYAKPEGRVLILTRYHHIRPASLEKAATRWPKLQIDFMTIRASKGQRADYIIIVGLQKGSDSFPAAAREPIIEEALLPPVEDFLDAKERRLMCVVLTRARYRVWALFNKENPSPLVEILKNLDVLVARKP